MITHGSGFIDHCISRYIAGWPGTSVLAKGKFYLSEAPLILATLGHMDTLWTHGHIIPFAF